jgi:hypothetical protein
VALDLGTVVLEANLDLAKVVQHLAYQAARLFGPVDRLVDGRQFAQVDRLVGALYPPGQEVHLADVLQASPLLHSSIIYSIFQFRFSNGRIITVLNGRQLLGVERWKALREQTFR